MFSHIAHGLFPFVKLENTKYLDITLIPLPPAFLSGKNVPRGIRMISTEFVIFVKPYYLKVVTSR